jgi:hypothetical protein
MTTLEAYRARDARISIGLPIKQDNGEYEYPGYVDGVLIGFYATRHHADLALHNILDTGLVALIGGAGVVVQDVEYAAFGF